MRDAHSELRRTFDCLELNGAACDSLRSCSVAATQTGFCSHHCRLKRIKLNADAQPRILCLFEVSPAETNLRV